MSVSLRPAALRHLVWPCQRKLMRGAILLVLGAAFAGLLLGGCRRAPVARLLGVRALGPARVERGDVLRLSGSGFPSGRDARLHLEGVVRRPAESEREVDITLVARAVSPERVEARADEALFAALGGGGTFRGRVEVAFDAAVPDADSVSGVRDDVVVSFMAPTAVRLSMELAHVRAANDLLAFLGAQPSADADASGVRIARVEDGSRAANAGLRKGDVVVESAGAIVTSLGDLAPSRDASVMVWRVARAGESAPLPLSLSLRGLGGGPDLEWSWAAALVAFVWLAALLRVASTARLVASAHRLLCAAARESASRKDVVVALGAGVLAALVAAAPHLPAALDVVSLFGALFALRVVSAARGGAVGRRARVGHAVLLELGAGLALASILLHAGTVRFAGLAAAQALAPLRLGVLAGPVPLVAAVLWLRLACLPESSESDQTETLLDGAGVRRSLAAALIALVAFGGAASTSSGAHFTLGALVLGPVAAALSLAASRFRSLGPARFGTLGLAAGALAASLVLAALPLGTAVEAILSRACVGLVLGTALVAAASVWRRPRPAALRVPELA